MNPQTGTSYSIEEYKDMPYYYSTYEGIALNQDCECKVPTIRT